MCEFLFAELRILGLQSIILDPGQLVQLFWSQPLEDLVKHAQSPPGLGDSSSAGQPPPGALCCWFV